MSLETGTRIQDLVPTNPVGATDFVSNGDDHIRLLKACIQGSLPNLGATAVGASAEELNILDGATLSTAELNVLDGITASTTELNYADGVTSAIQTQLDAKLGITAAAAAYQPLDADLTALAALATTSYGRDFNVLANDAALATKIAALAPSWTGQHLWTTNSPRVQFSTAGYDLWKDASPTLAGRLAINDTATGGVADGIHIARFTGALGWVPMWRATEAEITYGRTAGPAHTFLSGGAIKFNGLELGYKHLNYRIPTTTDSVLQSDNGKGIITNGTFTVTLENLEDCTLVTLFNAGGTITVTSSSGTLYWFNGSGTLGTGNRTLAIGAVVSFLRRGTDWYIWGTGVS